MCVGSAHMSRKQKGQLIETERSWFLRYYTPVEENGQTKKKQTCVRLCEKDDRYRFKQDVQPLVDQHMAAVNVKTAPVTGSMPIGDYVTNIYLPWVEQNKAASTYNGYKQIWKCQFEAKFGNIP